MMENEEFEKRLNKGLIIFTIIMNIMLLIAFTLLAVKQPKKQASAQEVTYNLEIGIYELSGTPDFNILPDYQNGGVGTTNVVPNGSIMIKPEVYNKQEQLSTKFENIRSIAIWGRQNETRGKRIEVTVNSDGDEVPNPNDSQTLVTIYKEETGYIAQILTSTEGVQDIAVEKYTMIVTQNLQVNRYIWEWIKKNTTKLTSTAEDYNNGYQLGYQQGIQDTISNNGGGFDGYQNGYSAGQAQGYQQGYQQAMKEIDANNPYTFNNLIGAVMRAPSEFFKSFWGTEILGFNLSGLISVMFTMALVFAIFGVVKKFI